MEKNKILFVDDEESIRNLVKRILQMAQYEVDLAGSGEEAVEKVSNNKYDVVITDITMSGIDGLEVLKKVKSINPATEVIVITGHGTVETAMKAINLGAYDYTTKPFDIGKLNLLVARCIEKQNLIKEVQMLKEKLQDKCSNHH